MPKIRTQRTKPPPEGYEDIQCVVLQHFLTPGTSWTSTTRRCATQSQRVTRASARWKAFGELAVSPLTTRPIMRISHARSRYIYDLYYKRELISRELYDWLLKQGYADAK